MASKSILPVEDERIVARDLQSRLRRLGYEVPAVASSRTEALELVKDFRPDVVLMDITLNGIPEGITAAKQIRDRYDLPVIYLTAHSDSDTLEQAKRTEPFGYLLKPFEDRELMAAIETAIHKHGSERRLRQTERWLAATLCSIGDAVITMDESLRITFMNRVAEELTGWSTEEAIGKDLFRVFRLSSKAAEAPARHVMKKVLSEGVPSALENPVLVAGDGMNISISDSVAPILDDQGKNSGLVLVFRDTTEKERAQREIRARGEQQAAANRLAQRALGGLDFQVLMDEAASEVCRLLHADVCETLEFSDDRRVLRRRSLVGAAAGEAQELSVSGAAIACIVRQPAPSAVHRATEGDPLLDRYHAQSAAGVIVGAPERPYGVLAVYSLSRRSFTENQLEFLQSVAYTLRSALDRAAMEKRLREREHVESVGVLAGGVAHDFNNLLAIIMGNADEVCRECSSSEPIRAILSATDRAAELTRQLLAYSGKGRFVSERVDLSALVFQSAEILRRAVPSQVTFDFALGENLPVFEADPNQVRQILVNLVTNAGEAIPPGQAGRILVATGAFELTPEMAPVYSSVYGAAAGHYVSLEVTDNGCGIDEASRSRIFEPFFTTKFTGRGLGLAGVQGIVRAHGGFIQVDSAPGSGATFRIFFPVGATNSVPAPVPPKSASRPASARNVLVVDDEPALRRMVVRMLERLGFHALEAENGAQALAVLEQSSVEPSVALLDLMMPVMGAAELLPILRSRYPGLKVIATSGYPEQEARRVLRSEPIAGFLQKPYHREALNDVLAKALN